MFEQALWEAFSHLFP